MKLPGLPPELKAVATAAPPCAHFGACGGCSFQRVPLPALREWKRDEVRRALAAQGMENIGVAATIAVPPNSRRRVEFAARRRAGRTVLGFMARESHDLVEIAECHVANPAIVSALPHLRALPLPDGEFDICVLLTQAGLDVAVSSPKPLALGAAPRESLARAATPFARLALNGETIAEFRKPVIGLAGIEMSPPPGAFLQPTLEGERVLQQAVAESVQGCRIVADLFSGCGTFTFALARNAKVHAVEGDAAHAEALSRAARRAQGLKPVAVERRDLFRRPLTGGELGRFDAVVMNPPRAGAKAQCEILGMFHVKHIAYVSCNPATFARDAKILTGSGYKLATVVPVDQFPWSPHIELAANFIL